ncbi:protein of unknown function [Pseudomonas sp. JV551A1]|nr:protein of unknown function [Pseudomonas sp. JV551A1]
MTFITPLKAARAKKLRRRRNNTSASSERVRGGLCIGSLPLSQSGSPCGGPYSGSCGFWSARRRVALRANGPKRCVAPTCSSVGCTETLGNIFLLYKIFELFISAIKNSELYRVINAERIF